MGLSAVAVEIVQDYWPVLIGLATITWLLSNKYGYGINRFPGPALAPWSNWWRFWQVLKYKNQYIQLELHQKYGEVVRLGPKVLSFSSPEARDMIYGQHNNSLFIKSDMYKCHQTNYKGERVESMFSTVDEKFHAMLRRCASNAFAMGTLQGYEPLMSSALEKWISQTGKLFAGTGKVCNIAEWTQFLAFDVVGQIAWSKEIGFTERNEDVENIIENIFESNREKTVVGQQPILDYVKDKNPIKFWLARRDLWPLPNDPLVKFGLDRMEERWAEHKLKKENKDYEPTYGYDFTERFIEMQSKYPEFLTNERILALQVSLVNAGSESTATTLTAIFFALMHHPRVLAKLVAEIDGAFASGKLQTRPNGLITWAESQHLPYFDAVVQEVWRFLTPPGANLERVVTQDGVVIAGHPIPKGTVVGCCAWTVHRRKEVFGEDADKFRPERWLDSSHEALGKMKNTMLQFGGGPRFCIGSNIAKMEIWKAIPSFLRLFEFDFADPRHENPREDWDVRTNFLAKPQEYNIYIKHRKHVAA